MSTPTDQSLTVSNRDPGDLMPQILAAAKDPNIDVEKMERLVQLHERMMAKQAESEFNDAMRLVQAKIPPIVKKASNPSTNSKFVKLENIQRILSPILLEHGFSISFGTDQSALANHYGVTALLSHTPAGWKQGHTRPYRCDVPADTHGPKGQQNKTATHGFGSAISYGQRYLLKLIFNIPFVGEDDDGNLGDKPKPPGPSVAEADKEERKKLRNELWRLLAPVRGTEQRWSDAQNWLWREEILDAAMPERVQDLTPERLKIVIEKVTEKLGAQ